MVRQTLRIADRVTAVIPALPSREHGLSRCVQSVMQQSTPIYDIAIAIDRRAEGSADTRTRALNRVTTRWAAFLDDDDEWLSNHISTFYKTLDDGHRFDVLYTGCIVVDKNGNTIPQQPEWGRFGEPFDPCLLRQQSYIPVTSFVRTELAQSVGGFVRPEGSPYDDWGFYLRMLDGGARFLHVPVVTWMWRHHGRNTSGLPEKAAQHYGR